MTNVIYSDGDDMYAMTADNGNSISDQIDDDYTWYGYNLPDWFVKECAE